ncbi:unnamed protein product [Rotaria sp. Silwood1]|nr:unnamed protein product [Rotaria sp. Silwood1]CAF1634164.1 unnamed protein product [Rotaria sp. Silwood1]CAF3784786.1 unnamed protein product [Rotaria sp. Silwood1]
MRQVTFSTNHVAFGLILLLICLSIGIPLEFHRLSSSVLQKSFDSSCFEWISDNQRLSTTYHCSNSTQISSFVWTYDGTGIMKYIQWIIIRKLANIKITRLNQDCYIIQENYFSMNLTNDMFIQIYIMSLSANLAVKSQSNYNIKYFLNYFISINLTIVNSEDLIKTNLIDCEKILINFISLLEIKNIIQYDSYQFIEDSTWWDQSNVAEIILNMSIPFRSENFTYSNDFYYLHGDRSFIQYLYDNRQCYSEGIFASF